MYTRRFGMIYYETTIHQNSSEVAESNYRQPWKLKKIEQITYRIADMKINNNYYTVYEKQTDMNQQQALNYWLWHI